MKKEPQHPGVYIQPPIFGLAIFIIASITENIYPLMIMDLDLSLFKIIACILITFAIIFGGLGIRIFWIGKTTVETFKPASSLQTSGIYPISRNPMYVGLITGYLAFAILLGNWWTILFTPFFFLTLNYYVIPHEEHYLSFRFGDEFINYKKRVRRWIGTY